MFLSQNSVDEERFPAFCEALKFYKDTEKGREIVCKIVEDYAKEYAVEKEKEAVLDTLYDSVKNLMDSLSLSVDKAMEVLKISNENREILRKRFWG